MSEKSQALRIFEICRGCAASVFGSSEPTAQYADAVSKLLFGTAVQESGLQWERQRSPRWDGTVGGFSKWQLEKGSIEASLAYLRTHPAMCARATAWLFDDPHAPVTWVDTMGLDAILWAMRLDDNDKIGCLFARLHYLRISEPVPDTVMAQAAYWKKYYNTVAGAGTVAQYLTNWRKVAGLISLA